MALGLKSEIWRKKKSLVLMRIVRRPNTGADDICLITNLKTKKEGGRSHVEHRDCNT